MYKVVKMGLPNLGLTVINGAINGIPLEDPRVQEYSVKSGSIWIFNEGEHGIWVVKTKPKKGQKGSRVMIEADDQLLKCLLAGAQAAEASCAV